MIDLTPLDVRKKRGDFRRILRGYDPEEVDTFMDLVAERLEELVRENLGLADQVERLGRQLGALEGREKAVQEALVSAQKLREEVGDQSRRDAVVMKEQAARTAELMTAKAETEISRRLGEAEALVREGQRALEDLERSRLKFLKSFRGLLERELDAVEVEEARRPLDDVPLELEFRGWMPEGAVEEGPREEDSDLKGNGEVSEGPDSAGEWEAAAEEPEVGLWESEVGAEPEPAEDPEPEPEVAEAEPEPEPTEDLDPEPVAAEAELEADLAEAREPETPGAHPNQFDEDEEEAEGFVTQVLEVPPAPLLENPGADDWPRESDGGSDRDGNSDSGLERVEQEGEDADPASDEPRWLFSLLKREDEREG